MQIDKIKLVIKEELLDENFPQPCEITKHIKNDTIYNITRCNEGAEYKITCQVNVRTMHEGERISVTETQDLQVCMRHLRLLKMLQAK